MDANVDLRAEFEQIEKNRAAQAISMAELARVAGLSESTYHRLAGDKGRVPTRRTVIKLADGLKRLVGEAA